VDELDRHADALGAAPLVHQAGAVGGHDVFRPGPGMVADLVVPHLGRHSLLEERECPSEAAAFVGTRRGDELNGVDLRQQMHRLRKEGRVEFGRPRMLERAQRSAAVVQADPMRETRPGERLHLQDVVQELDKLEDAGPNRLDLFGLLDGIFART